MRDFSFYFSLKLKSVDVTFYTSRMCVFAQNLFFLLPFGRHFSKDAIRVSTEKGFFSGAFIIICPLVFYAP